MPLRSFSQTDMLFDERRRIERPLLAMIWLGAMALSVIEGSALYLGAATVAVVANLLAVRHQKEISLRRLYINIAVVLASLVLLAELLMKGGDMKLSLGHYLILIQLCKLFERKTNRDYVQVMVLSTLVMVVGILLSNELWFAVTLVVYLALACYAACVFTLKRGLDAAAANGQDAASREAHASGLTIHWPGGPLRRYAALALSGMLLVGTVLFLLAPRGEAWGNTPGILSRSSGMAAVPKLGQARKIYQSDRIVMTVTQQGGPVSAYMRGKVFYTYTDSHWIPGQIGSPYDRLRPVDATMDEPAAAVQQVVMKANYLTTLFATPPAGHVEFVGAWDDYGRVDLTGDPSAALAMTPSVLEVDGTFRLRVPSDVKVRLGSLEDVVYRVYVRPETSPRRADRQPAYAAAVAAMMDNAPPPLVGSRTVHARVYTHPNVAALAERWCADLADPDATSATPDDERCLRIADRLADNLRKRCSYTLDLTDATGSRDGVEDFLFYLKRGHCEYFASALTVMCRHLNVPARYVQGFHASSAGGTGGKFVVRERNAHAWTEVYVPSRGWVIIDATPAAGRGTGDQTTGWLAGLWNSAKAFWHEKIIEYDAAAREALAKRIRDALAAVGRALSDMAQAVAESFVNLVVSGVVDRLLFRLAIGVCSLGLAVEVLLIVRAVRRRRKRRKLVDAGQAVPAAQFEFAKTLFDLLTRHGPPWAKQLTVRQWARQAAETLTLPPQDIDELIALYYRLRWGRLAANDDELARAAARVEQFQRQLAG